MKVKRQAEGAASGGEKFDPPTFNFLTFPPFSHTVSFPKMSFAERFEDLRIWQDARTQVKAVYRALEKGTAGHSDLGFRTQMQRASISVMNNIAEGFERSTPKDFAHFLDLAKGSCGEVRSLLYVAEDLGYLQPERAGELREFGENLSRGIAAFTKQLRA